MDDQDTAAGLSDFDGAEGACIACLYEDELDQNGLCASCNPISKEDLAIVNRALNPTKEVTTSENN
jgi:hypothetical protein